MSAFSNHDLTPLDAAVRRSTDDSTSTAIYVASDVWEALQAVSGGRTVPTLSAVGIRIVENPRLDPGAVVGDERVMRALREAL